MSAMESVRLAFALMMMSTATFADELTLACTGKAEARGQGEPIIQEVTGSVVVGSNWVSFSLVLGLCPITSTTPNGVNFKCPLPTLGGGWYWERTGYLDRFNGDLEVNTIKTPPANSNNFGTTETYLMTCKPAKRMF
jgi:hypothetical protein